MELTLNRGVLGQYDAGSNLRYKGKEKYVDKFFEYIAGAIAIIGAIILFFSCLGACMGCKSVMSCYDDCSCSCAKYIVQGCYEAGEGCRESAGCPSSSSSSSSSSCTPSTTYTTKTYKAINGVTGQYDYWYVKTYKRGCKTTGTTTEHEYSVDTTYWNLEGIYSDANMTKEVTLESMKENKVYYTKWSRVDEGVEYTLSFTVSGLSSQSSVLSVQHVNVGADEIDWNDVWSDVYNNLPTKENYEFSGIYFDGVQIVDKNGNVNTDYLGAFDLETWSITPGNRKVTVEVRFDPTPIKLTIYSLYSTSNEPLVDATYDYGDSLYSILVNNSTLNKYTIDYYYFGDKDNLTRYTIYQLQGIYLEEDTTIYVDNHKDSYSFKAYDLEGQLLVSQNVSYNLSYADIIDYYLYNYMQNYSVTGFSFESSPQAAIYTLEDLYDRKVTSDVVLYVRSVEFYTMIFWVGNDYYQARIPIEDNANLPSLDERYNVDGFTFGGWYLTAETTGTPVTELSYVINNNIDTLYAKLTGRQYHLYFYDGVSNSPIKTQTYETSANDRILPGEESLDVPSGYTYGGWYLRDDENKTPITKIKAYDYGDKYIIALLIPIKYNVQLRPGTNGTLPVADRTQHLDYGSTPTIPVPTPKEGYKFNGYTYNGKLVTDAEGKFKDKFTEALFDMTFADFSQYESNSIRLDASIEIIKFDVILMDGSIVVDSQKVEYGKYPILATSPTPKQGDVFEGWNEDSASTYGSSLESFVIKKDTTLYAIYSKVRIKITYVDKVDPVSQITLPQSTSTSYIKYATSSGTQNAVARPNYDNRPDYEFDGYYYGSVQVTDGKGKLLIDFNETSLGISYDTLVTGIELEVSSKLTEFTVQFFDGNNPYGEVQVLHYNDHITEPESPTPLPGYTFMYWTTLNGTSAFNFNTYQVTENISLYSNYQANKYNVNLVVDDFADQAKVTINPASLQLTYDGSISLTVPQYDGDEYEFVGYYIGDNQLTDTNCQGLNNIKFNIDSLRTYGITNIQAFETGIEVTTRYQTKQFTVTYYDSDNSTIYTTRTVKYGTPATELTGPQKEGYMFVGWGTKANSSTLYDFSLSQGVTKDIYLYPKYTDKVSVNFYAQDGTTKLTSITVNYGQSLSIGSSVYNLTGVAEWYLLEDSTEIIAEWAPDANMYYIYIHSWSSDFSTSNVIGEINLVAGTN